MSVHTAKFIVTKFVVRNMKMQQEPSGVILLLQLKKVKSSKSEN
jgi:hypothetical protein